MKGAALPFLSALALVGGIASAQAANDSAVPLPTCSLMERADPLECLDTPSRAASPALRLAQAGDGWVVSETTSPIDYSPIATATIAPRDVAGGSPLQLSIRCRGGRTELALTGPAITGRGDNYLISYRVNGDQSVQLAGVTAAFGAGVAFKGDVVALLQQLPGDGELAVHLKPLSGNELDGIFSLNGLETLRTRIGATCKWPQAIARPADR
jgi:hypothetical protein